MVAARELDPGASPLAFFGAELRRHRQAAGLSQDDLGRAISYSGALVGRIEMAERMPSREFADHCDQALHTDGFFARLWSLVKSEAFPTWFGPFVELEEQATRIHTWDQRLVPGLIQTEEYARSVMRMTRPGEPSEVIERDVAARLERQAILARERPPRLWFVIDEAALRRPLGSREVARGQLKHLLDVAEMPFAVVQVLPLAVSEHPGADGSLIVLEFASGPPVAYAEGWRTGRLTESAAEVEDAVVVFDLIRAAALARGASLDLIRAIEEEL